MANCDIGSQTRRPPSSSNKMAMAISRRAGRIGLTSDGFRIYNTSDHYFASIMERDQAMFARLLLGGVLVALVTFSAGANAKDSGCGGDRDIRREGHRDISQGRRLIKEGRRDIRDGQI